jgi:hypothetical protein
MMIRSNKLQALMQLKARLALIIVTFVMVCCSSGLTASAITQAPNGTPCPPSLPKADCNALYGPWPNWDPGSGPKCGAAASSSGNGATLTGGTNIEKAFNYFTKTRGLTAVQAAGIIGNLMVEDPGLVPDTVQGGGHSATIVPGTGYGIAQWTTADRQAGLIEMAVSEGSTVNQLNVQLDYLWKELTTTHSSALDDLKQQTALPGTIDQQLQRAADSFMVHFEAPKDHAIGGANSIARGKNAKQVYNSFASGSGSTAGNVSATSAASCSTAVTCTPGSAAGGTTGTPPSTTSTAGLSAVRQNAVCIAENELATVWTPLPGIPRLQYYKYSDNVPEEWCADFVSWVYQQAGQPFTGGQSGGWRIAAVSGIWDLGKQNGTFHFHDSAGYTPKPGDLAIHKSEAAGVSHVNMVISVSGTTVTLIGGDQGPGPYGGTDSASIVSKVTQTSIGGDYTVGYVGPD